jgi:MFS family permease
VRATLSDTFRSLRVRNYRLFAIGQLVKLIGVWMMFTAQDWLVLQLSGNSPTALGLVTALQFSPVLLLTLYGGKLADRYDKRRLLLLANGAYGAGSLLLATLVATGAVQLWHIFVFAAVLGVANSIETPVRQSFVSELVGVPLLPNALSLSAASFNSARIVGPALAGVAIALFGTGPVFVISTVATLSPLVGLSRMRPAELFREALPPREERAEARIVDGLRYVRNREDLLLPMALMLVVGLAGFNFQVTLALLAKTVFHAGAASFGLFSTALAVGALCGALAGSGRRSRPSVYVVLGSGVGFAAAETLTGLAPTFWAMAGLLALTGFLMMFYAQSSNQRVQLGVDAAYRGRVMALYMLVFLGTNPIGAVLNGWCADVLGPRACVYLGGLISLLATVGALSYQLHRTGARVRLQVYPMPRFYVVQPVD